MSGQVQFGGIDFGQGGLNDRLDLDSLLTETDLDRAEIQWRKEFVGFDDDDVRRLEKYQELFGRHAEQIADDFYENLTDYDEAIEVMDRSPKTVEQLKRTQSAYLLTLTSGEYGLDHFRNRARIGKLHDMLDMPMKL